MTQLKCNSCGGFITPNNQEQSIQCMYCGAIMLNPLFNNPLDLQPQQSAQGGQPVFGMGQQMHLFNGVQTSPQFNQPPQFVPPRPRMSGCAVAALAIFFWPAAIIYAISVSRQQADWDIRYGGRM